MRGNCVSKMVVVLENKETYECGIYCAKFSTMDTFHYMSVVPIKKSSLSSQDFHNLCSKISEMISTIHEDYHKPFGDWIELGQWNGIGLAV